MSRVLAVASSQSGQHHTFLRVYGIPCAWVGRFKGEGTQLSNPISMCVEKMMKIKVWAQDRASKTEQSAVIIDFKKGEEQTVAD